ncbi:MAG TPA: ATP-binding protein [Rudaea sp.]|jgi:signal transduction histidine kinase|nr:ATP-binding protein [Rudaea sp.]
MSNPVPARADLQDAHTVADESADALRAAIAERDEVIAALNAELAATNQGVVALYAELDDRAEQLGQATDLKSKFLSYMSHEFRLPLSSIISITRLLLQRLDGPLTTEQERQVTFIRGSANELSTMVNDLLDLAKIEAGRITISPGWFEMVDLFAALRGIFKPILVSDNVSLIFEEPEGLSRIYTDHSKLAQILRNFISNALKFTTQGEVRVSARQADGDDGRAMAIFAVKDTGIGIAAEHQHALFQDFVQIDTPIQKRLRGTGLGLSLSKRLAEVLHGSVAVQSELGAGSTFFLTIPVQLPE